MEKRLIWLIWVRNYELYALLLQHLEILHKLFKWFRVATNNYFHCQLIG